MSLIVGLGCIFVLLLGVLIIALVLRKRYPTLRNEGPRFRALSKPLRDVYNFEHDMIVGPCACGSWHKGAHEYLSRLYPEGRRNVEAQITNTPNKNSVK